MVESCIVRSAYVRHRSPGNSGIDLVGRRVRFILVERYEHDIEVRCGAGGSEKVMEPVPCKCYTSVVAVVLDVGLCRDQVN